MSTWQPDWVACNGINGLNGTNGLLGDSTSLSGKYSTVKVFIFEMKL